MNSQRFRGPRQAIDGALGSYKEKSDVFDLIEDAYISVRYMGRRYSDRSAKKAAELLKMFKEVSKR